MQQGHLWNDRPLDRETIRKVVDWLGASDYQLTCPEVEQEARWEGQKERRTMIRELDRIEQEIERGLTSERMYEERQRALERRLAKQYREAYERYRDAERELLGA